MEYDFVGPPPPPPLLSARDFCDLLCLVDEDSTLFTAAGEIGSQEELSVICDILLERWWERSDVP